MLHGWILGLVQSISWEPRYILTLRGVVTSGLVWVTMKKDDIWYINIWYEGAVPYWVAWLSEVWRAGQGLSCLIYQEKKSFTDKTTKQQPTNPKLMTRSLQVLHTQSPTTCAQKTLREYWLHSYERLVYTSGMSGKSLSYRQAESEGLCQYWIWLCALSPACSD